MKTGRNDPCPCGSLKKFKKCCALTAASAAAVVAVAPVLPDEAASATDPAADLPRVKPWVPLEQQTENLWPNNRTRKKPW